MGSPVTITPDSTPNSGAPVTITPDAPRAVEQPDKKGFLGALWEDIKGLVPQGQNPYAGMGQDQKSTAYNQSVEEGQDRHNAGYSIPYQLTAPVAQSVGVNVTGMEDAAKHGDTGAIYGHIVTPVAALAAGEAISHDLPGRVMDRAAKSRIGRNLTVSPELRRAAAQVPDATTSAIADGRAQSRDVPSALKQDVAATPDAKTTADAARTAKDINTAASQELNGKLHQELDAHAQELGVNVSTTDSARVKAHRIGDALQKKAQELYSKADEVAQQVTGQPGRFQDIAQNVRDIQDEIRFERDPEARAKLQKALDAAQTDYETYKQGLADAGMDLGVVKQADKHWSIGTSYKEVGRAVGRGERLSGQLAPGANPLDASIKNIAREGEKRGHVLKNAMGDDRSARVLDAVKQAGDRVARESAETRAAKKSVQDITQRASAAQSQIDAIKAGERYAARDVVRETAARAAEAQKRIDRVQANRRKIGYGVAGAALGGVATKYASALVGDNTK